MDKFIGFLEENSYDEQDKKTIIKFKEKLNKPISDYKQHLMRYKFSEEWFSELDDILIELGYRALDVDISYIKTELIKIIHDTHVNKIIKKFNKIKKTNINKFSITLNHNFGYIDAVEIINPFIYNIDYLPTLYFSINENPIAVKYLIDHPDKIIWDYFSFNKSDIAVRYCIEHPDNVNWYEFSSNENSIAVCYLIDHSDKIKWAQFSSNDNSYAVRYLIHTHPDKIDLYTLSLNQNDLAVEYLIINHSSRIDWKHFSRNENSIAVRYLIDNSDKIDWWYFSSNMSDIAVRWCIEHPDKIHWERFLKNKNILAVSHCIENFDKIDRKSFSENMGNATTYKYLHEDGKNILYELSPTHMLRIDNSVEFSLHIENYSRYFFHDLKQWKIYKFNELNWLSSSKMIL